ncbi:MAG: 4Fe-4S binding protein [Candidatus Mariimomonas ferrooxydans]
MDYDRCKGCGICFHECPCSAIKLKFKEVDY